MVLSVCSPRAAMWSVSFLPISRIFSLLLLCSLRSTVAASPASSPQELDCYLGLWFSSGREVAELPADRVAQRCGPAQKYQDSVHSFVAYSGTNAPYTCCASTSVEAVPSFCDIRFRFSAKDSRLSRANPEHRCCNFAKKHGIGWTAISAAYGCGMVWKTLAGLGNGAARRPCLAEWWGHAGEEGERRRALEDARRALDGAGETVKDALHAIGSGLYNMGRYSYRNTFAGSEEETSAGETAPEPVLCDRPIYPYPDQALWKSSALSDGDRGLILRLSIPLRAPNSGISITSLSSLTAPVTDLHKS